MEFKDENDKDINIFLKMIDIEKCEQLPTLDYSGGTVPANETAKLGGMRNVDIVTKVVLKNNKEFRIKVSLLHLKTLIKRDDQNTEKDVFTEIEIKYIFDWWEETAKTAPQCMVCKSSYWNIDLDLSALYYLPDFHNNKQDTTRQFGVGRIRSVFVIRIVCKKCGFLMLFDINQNGLNDRIG